MVILLIIVSVVAVAYALFILSRHGVPESLSATYYLLGRNGWLLQCVLGTLAVLLYPVWFSVSGNSWVFLSFLGCASLLFVAFAPCFRLELEGMVHYSSAIVCCVCALGWQIAEGLWDVTLWFAFVGGMLCLRYRAQWCWCLECVLVGSLIANLWRLS